MSVKAARKLRNINLYLTIFWVAATPIVLVTGLKSSLPFIVFISMYAIDVTHFSAWIASRAEVASETNPEPPSCTD